MPSFASQIYASAGRYGSPQSQLRLFASSKPTRALLIAVICLISIFFFSRRSSDSPQRQESTLQQPSAPVQDARFNLLVPATSSGADLCKLLLSAQILDYPTPVLINFGATEFEDAYVQHLAKVEGILKYLDSLENSGSYAEDLVLIVDGYDVWFQLRAETLIQRYYELNSAANARLVGRYGKQVVDMNDIRQTIIFGPDKICWPIDYGRPACWAVMDATLDNYAFGPESFNFQSRTEAKWLNSGTILGPVGDLKELFKATVAEIHANHSTDSDQYYMAEVYGRQEFARLHYRPDIMEEYKSIRYGDEVVDPSIELVRNDPNMTGITKTEYHVGIDFDSAMFQTMAFWKQYLTWMKPENSWAGGPGGANGPYTLRMPADIEMSPPPFMSLATADETTDTAVTLSWNSMELLYNTITRQIPAMIHFTGEKRFRHIWWKKIWFQSRAKQLREAKAREAHEHEKPFGPIGGYLWHNAEPVDAEEVNMHGVGGAWSDRGGWFSWKSLCGAHENDIYEVPDDVLFHQHLEKKDSPVETADLAKNIVSALKPPE